MCRATLENNVSNGDVGIAAGINPGFCICLLPRILLLRFWATCGIRPVKANERNQYRETRSFGKRVQGNGDIFRYPSRTLRTLPICILLLPGVFKVSYHPEPGFYFGAMYITYAINVVLVVVVGALANYVLDIRSIFQLLIIAIAAVLITLFSFAFPVSFGCIGSEASNHVLTLTELDFGIFGC